MVQQQVQIEAVQMVKVQMASAQMVRVGCIYTYMHVYISRSNIQEEPNKDFNLLHRVFAMYMILLFKNCGKRKNLSSVPSSS